MLLIILNKCHGLLAPEYKTIKGEVAFADFHKGVNLKTFSSRTLKFCIAVALIWYNIEL